MSVHVLLNLLNELVIRDKMRGLLSILSLFRNEFYKYIQYNKSTNVRFYISYDIKNTLKSHFWRKYIIMLDYVRTDVMVVISFPVNL